MALTDNLVSYYKLDETSGTTATDSHGSQNGTSSNVTVNQTGKIEKAYLFNGTSSKISDNDNSIMTQQSGSVSLWMYSDLSQAVNMLVAEGKSTAGLPYAMLLVESNGAIGFYTDNGAATSTISAAGAVPANQWVHVVVTHDGTTTTIYVNNSNVKSGTTNWFGDMAGDTFCIGVLDRATDYAWFDGLIDEVGIWSRVLTSTEVSELYNSGNGLAYPFSAEEVTTQVQMSGDGLNWSVCEQ